MGYERAMKPTLLQRHPESASNIPVPWVTFRRDRSVLRMTFRIPGDTSAIAFPESLQSGLVDRPDLRGDRLWEHTCFEAFVQRWGETEYLEFNFSPSGEWAAYRFDDYRTHVRDADVRSPMTITTAWENRFELSAIVAIADWADVDWRANFSAVIEEKDGAKSYWALSHCDEKPDFHNPACFVAQLPAIAHE